MTNLRSLNLEVLVGWSLAARPQAEVPAADSGTSSLYRLRFDLSPHVNAFYTCEHFHIDDEESVSTP